MQRPHQFQHPRVLNRIADELAVTAGGHESLRLHTLKKLRKLGLRGDAKLLKIAHRLLSHREMAEHLKSLWVSKQFEQMRDLVTLLKHGISVGVARFHIMIL